VSFAAITLCVASQRVFIVVNVYFVIDSVRKLLDTPSYVRTIQVGCDCLHEFHCTTSSYVLCYLTALKLRDLKQELAGKLLISTIGVCKVKGMLDALVLCN
jgi:hypothetical protein